MGKQRTTPFLATVVIAGALLLAGCKKDNNEKLPGTWEYQYGTVEVQYDGTGPYEGYNPMGETPDIRKVVFNEDGTASVWRWDGAYTAEKNYEAYPYTWEFSAQKDSIYLASSERADKMSWKIHHFTNHELDISFCHHIGDKENHMSIRYIYVFHKKRNSK